MQLLSKDYVRSTSTVQHCQTSSDQSTTKLLIRLQDGQQVESVIMHYDTTGGASVPRWWHTPGAYPLCLHKHDLSSGCRHRGRPVVWQEACHTMCVLPDRLPDGLHLLRDRWESLPALVTGAVGAAQTLTSSLMVTQGQWG